MEKKVLIVDDSALMRRMMSDIINSKEYLTVADTASSGISALDLLNEGKHYDIILSDIKMPKMDGVEFLKQLNHRRIHIPVLIVSSIASESAKETIQALELGAFDFVKKPNGSVGKEFREFEQNLITRIYYACGMYNKELEREPEPKPKREPEPKPKKEKISHPTEDKTSSRSKGGILEVSNKKRDNKSLVVIASSTGGPRALQSVIPLFPKDFPYPVVVIQHMPAGFTTSLATRLNEMSPIHVKEAEDGELLEPGNVYIAQGGKQCELLQTGKGVYRISENDKPARGGLKPCADIFFESLADTSIDNLYCIVLTGMGADASKGIKLVKKQKNVKVIAQNQETCVVYGMPRAAKMEGIVDYMVPLLDVTATLIKKIGV
ncbi:MAG: chemotaxis-specific protein-glutamate methyltransferase CheB [Eubacterium sp.]|nr:chemotaxis-specific protein-glutamate methyltransferase CheB [Eubacterium sp.]